MLVEDEGVDLAAQRIEAEAARPRSQTAPKPLAVAGDRSQAPLGIGGRYGSISWPFLALMAAWVRVAAPSLRRALSM
jgi:hypothetical protein